MDKDTRICFRCGEIKPIACFSLKATRCKPCLATQRREQYANDASFRAVQIERSAAANKRRYDNQHRAERAMRLESYLERVIADLAQVRHGKHTNARAIARAKRATASALRLIVRSKPIEELA